ncbi:hypothetical protein CEUSTIGMA_g697.t1 [Chlamydomonas eustigma]|uniref:F-box domain-containing protein n=1 Tax=Chlamydomonas eustigma TaxID=1157962 RepID=A0A250WR01_9CHLO|nr:hypothetical protein CEUSTIGMA_g697.t1 [Chlamydomonas eustigma]|eukprot:GAX73243.1 hypothetical protein CEUSTIGMA_g697.t1 [Chlamydomonas eustigma]
MVYSSSLMRCKEYLTCVKKSRILKNNVDHYNGGAVHYYHEAPASEPLVVVTALQAVGWYREPSLQLPDSALATIISHLTSWSRRQMRLVCSRFRQLVEQQVEVLTVNAGDITPLRFPFLKRIEVYPWKESLTESDMSVLLLSIPKLSRLQSIRILLSPDGKAHKNVQPQLSSNRQYMAGLLQLVAPIRAAQQFIIHNACSPSFPFNILRSRRVAAHDVGAGKPRDVQRSSYSEKAIGSLFEALLQCCNAPQWRRLRAPSWVAGLGIMISDHDGIELSLIHEGHHSHTAIRLMEGLQMLHKSLSGRQISCLSNNRDFAKGLQASIERSMKPSCEDYLKLSRLGFLTELRLDLTCQIGGGKGMLGRLCTCTSLKRLDLNFLPPSSSLQGAFNHSADHFQDTVIEQATPQMHHHGMNNGANSSLWDDATSATLSGFTNLHPSMDNSNHNLDYTGRPSDQTDRPSDHTGRPSDSIVASQRFHLHTNEEGALLTLITNECGLHRLVALSLLDTLTLRGEVALSQCGFESLASLSQVEMLTLWLKEYVTAQHLLPLSKRMRSLRTLQLSRLHIQEQESIHSSMNVLPCFPHVTSLNYYLADRCSRDARCARVFPAVVTAMCRDWPGASSPNILRGMPHLTTLVLMQHSLCSSNVVLATANDNAAVSVDRLLSEGAGVNVESLKGLLNLKSLTFKSALQEHHMLALMEAAKKMPKLKHLYFIAAPNFRPTTTAKAWYRTRSHLLSLKCLEAGGALHEVHIHTLVLDTQGSRWEVLGLFVNSTCFPALYSLKIKNCREPLSLRSLKSIIETRMPSLKHLELKDCCPGGGIGPHLTSSGIPAVCTQGMSRAISVQWT